MKSNLFLLRPELSSATTKIFIAYLILYSTIILMQVKKHKELYNKLCCKCYNKHDDLCYMFVV